MSAIIKNSLRIVNARNLVETLNESADRWETSTAYSLGDIVSYDKNMYICTVAGTSGATAPTHTTGSASDGTVTWLFYKTVFYKSLYAFIGRVAAWASPSSDTSPPTPVDDVEQEFLHYTEMLALKKLTTADAVQCIPRYDWTSGTHYNMYEHDKSDLFSSLTPFYVLTDDYHVYKCIGNGGSAGGSGSGGNSNSVTSTVKPTGTSVNIITTADGYRWKYMYTLTPADTLRFLTNDYMPIRYLTGDDGSAQWDVQNNAATTGVLEHIEVLDGGSGYNDGSLTVNITGGGGTGATATATVSSGIITGITVTNGGSGYTSEPTVSITDAASPAGTGVSLKAILSPTGGHGANPLTELGAFYTMFNIRLEYAESGYFPITGSQSIFRKIGLIIDPEDNSTGDVAQASLYLGPLHDEYATSPVNAYNKIQENTGTVIYIEEREPIQRASDQIEDIKLIIET